MSDRINSLLIVDDEKSNIIALTHILGPMYTIYAARNGQDALNVANAQMPDLILLDVQMPGMNGFEVIAALKANHRTCAIPVIFVTGLDSAEDEERGLALDAADYISKPFSPSIVKLRVRNQMQMLEQLSTIERLSMMDQLTGIPNRRSLDNRLEAEWSRAVRDSIPISVIMIDIDYFKRHNDQYGHQQGDKALQTVAKTISDTLKRADDFVARWGGEEFMVLLQNTFKEGALQVAEQIRQTIEETVIPLADGTTCTITVSMGVNTMIPSKESLMSAFVSGADKALYTAKESGRNRVCLFEDV